MAMRRNELLYTLVLITSGLLFFALLYHMNHRSGKVVEIYMPLIEEVQQLQRSLDRSLQGMQSQKVGQKRVNEDLVQIEQQQRHIAAALARQQETVGASFSEKIQAHLNRQAALLRRYHNQLSTIPEAAAAPQNDRHRLYHAYGDELTRFLNLLHELVSAELTQYHRTQPLIYLIAFVLFIAMVLYKLRRDRQRAEIIKAMQTYSQRLEERIAERTQALEKALEEAKEADRVKGEFIANIRHEIRTPMHAVLTLTEQISADPGAPSAKKWLQEVQRSAKSLWRLLNDMLDFSSLEARFIRFEAERFALKHLVKVLEEEFTSAASAKGVEFSVELQAPLPDYFLGDEMRLRQLLWNLLNNAVKFTPEGESIRFRLRGKAVDEERYRLHFSVEDSGIGIAKSQQANLFRLFSQGETSTTRRYGGVGLGLVLARRIVTLMHGELGFESTPGKGSTFNGWVELEYESAVSKEEIVFEPAHHKRGAVNTQRGVAMFGGNEGEYTRFLKRFALHYSNYIQQLSEAKKEGKEALERWLHTLKGTAANIGAYRLAESANAAYELLQHNHGEAFSGVQSLLEEEIEAVNRFIGSFGATDQTHTPVYGESSQALTSAKLERLRSLITAGDTEAIDLLEALCRCAPLDKESVRCEAVARALRGYDFLQAKALLSELEKALRL